MADTTATPAPAANPSSASQPQMVTTSAQPNQPVQSTAQTPSTSVDDRATSGASQPVDPYHGMGGRYVALGGGRRVPA